MDSTQDTLNWLRLSRTERIGPVTFKQLLENYGSAQNALDNIGELSRRGGRSKPLTPPPIGEIEKLYKQCEKLGVRVLCQFDALYSEPLKEIHDAPPVLFLKGNPLLLQKDSIGIVGARNASTNGQTFTKKMAAELGAKNLTVVSGLAKGVDTAAHTGSLATGTVAVLGGGIDHIYPPENKKLYNQIAEQGCIISEHAPGMIPKAQHFPRRNRIISGLSLGILVVEAAKRSGSLITARMAMEQNRDVFSVPGSPLDPRCQGTNNLIKQGAYLVQDSADILDNLPQRQQRSPANPLSRTLNDNNQNNSLQNSKAIDDGIEAAKWRDKIVEALSPTPTSLTDVIQTSGAPVKIANVVLLELYLAGKVEHHHGGKVALVCR